MKDKPPEKIFIGKNSYDRCENIIGQFIGANIKSQYSDDIEYIQADLLEPLKKVWQCFRHVYNERQYNFSINPYTEALGIMWKSLDNLANKLGWDKEDKNE